MLVYIYQITRHPRNLNGHFIDWLSRSMKMKWFLLWSVIPWSLTGVAEDNVISLSISFIILEPLKWAYFLFVSYFSYFEKIKVCYVSVFPPYSLKAGIVEL
jgi:hypothetical protein